MQLVFSPTDTLFNNITMDHDKLIEKVHEYCMSTVDDLTFSEYVSLDTNMGMSRNIRGLYRIRHVSNPHIVLYYGEGKITPRICRHRDVYNNGGRDMVTENSSSGSQVAKKMYEHDSSSIDNWQYSYARVDLDCHIDLLKTIIEIYENLLVERDEPLYNVKSMTGIR